MIKAEAIERIRVALDADAALPLVYDVPKDALDAKFSLHFAIAAAIIEGSAGLKQFTARCVRDPRIRTLMKRIQLVRRPVEAQKRGGGIDTEIELMLMSGERHRAQAAFARGHPTLLPSRAEIEDKFRQCADGVLPARTVSKFLNAFSALERASSIAAWLRPLRAIRR